MTDLAPATLDATISPRIWAEVHLERLRAHAKHGENSIESDPAFSLLRLAVLMEEVGEVAREFCEARHRCVVPESEEAELMVNAVKLRTELIQVAAMAGAWADVLTEAGT